MSRDQDRANAFLNRLVKTLPKPSRQEQVRAAALKRKKEWFGQGARGVAETDPGASAPHEPPSMGSRLATLRINEHNRTHNVEHPNDFEPTNTRPLARFGHDRGWGYLVHDTEIDEQLEHIPQHRRDALARDYSAGTTATEGLAAAVGIPRRQVLDKRAARRARGGT